MATFRLPAYSELARIAMMNAVVGTVSVASERSNIWWLWGDGDEIVVPAGSGTIRSNLERVDPRVRVVGTHYFDHWPDPNAECAPDDGVFGSAPSRHSALPAPALSITASTRFRSSCVPGYQSNVGLDFTAPCAPSSCSRVSDSSLITHHFPYRHRVATEQRLQKLIEEDRLQSHGVELGKESNLSRRSRHLDDVYAGRWDALGLATTPTAVEGAREGGGRSRSAETTRDTRERPTASGSRSSRAPVPARPSGHRHPARRSEAPPSPESAAGALTPPEGKIARRHMGRGGAMLPNFIIIGAMKSGTTSLARYLDAHPEIFITRPREPRFFSDGYDSGLDSYERLFEGAAAGQVRGEGSTNYSVAGLRPGVPKRIAAVCPDVKLIYLLRDPVERIRSLYRFRLDRKPDLRPIDRAVFEIPVYLESARYATQLDAYLEHFDRRQVLVLSSERLYDDRSQQLSLVYAFLGVDADFVPSDVDATYNTARDNRRMPAPLAAVRTMLIRSSMLDRIPVSAKRALRVATMRGQDPSSGEISDELRARIHGELHDDMTRLRTIVGPSFDLWGLA